mgnify:CR=1 FL=1
MTRNLRNLAPFAFFAALGCGTPPAVAPQPVAPKTPIAAKPVVMPEAWNRWRPFPWDATPAPLPSAARVPIDPAAILPFGGAARTFASLSEYDREQLAKNGIRLLSSKETTLGEALREPLTRGGPTSSRPMASAWSRRPPSGAHLLRREHALLNRSFLPC